MGDRWMDQRCDSGGAKMATPHKDNKIRSAHYQIKGWDMS